MYTYGIVPDHDLADCVLCVNIDRVFKSVREVCRQINMRCVGCVLTFCSCMSWCPSVYKEGVEGLKKLISTLPLIRREVFGEEVKEFLVL